MKYFVILCLLALIGATVKAQSNTPEAIATRIAQRMKDSLSLSEPQRTQLYTINMQIHQEKAIAWQEYRSDSTVLRQQLQLQENSRDSLYKGILNEQQYELYRQKKIRLVNNN